MSIIFTTIRILLLAFLVFGQFLFLATPVSFAQASQCDGGDFIVPCGRSCDDPGTPNIDESSVCTLCHLIIGLKNLVDGMIRILTPVVLVALVVAGIMYSVSAGNESLILMAKRIVTFSLGGFGIVLLSWVVINSLITVFLPTRADLGIGAKRWYEIPLSCAGISGGTREDRDGDGITDESDNCPLVPNGPDAGSCAGGVNAGKTCSGDADCSGGSCSKNQEDSDGDGIGDVCEDLCETRLALTCTRGAEESQYIALDTTGVKLPSEAEMFASEITTCTGAGGTTSTIVDVTDKIDEWEIADENVAITDFNRVRSQRKGDTQVRAKYIKNGQEFLDEMDIHVDNSAYCSGSQTMRNHLPFVSSADATSGCQHCGTENQCEFLYGNKDADNIFIFALANDAGMSSETWDLGNAQSFRDEIRGSESKKFIDKAIGVSDKFGVFLSKNILTIDYNGRSFSFDPNCPKKRFTGYMYVYKSGGRSGALRGRGISFLYKEAALNPLVVVHEAMGHAFGVLDDEYDDKEDFFEDFSNDSIFEPSSNCFRSKEECGYALNVECIEGCRLGRRAFTRESYDSIMRMHNTDDIFSPNHLQAIRTRVATASVHLRPVIPLHYCENRSYTNRDDFSCATEILVRISNVFGKSQMNQNNYSPSANLKFNFETSDESVLKDIQLEVVPTDLEERFDIKREQYSATSKKQPYLIKVFHNDPRLDYKFMFSLFGDSSISIYMDTPPASNPTGAEGDAFDIVLKYQGKEITEIPMQVYYEYR